MYTIAWAIALSYIFTVATASSADSYATEVETWRAEREKNLKADRGWASLAGLYWLKSGRNTLGAGKGNDVVLPAGSAPETLGVAVLDGKAVTIDLASDSGATIDGKPVGKRVVHSDKGGSPDRIVLNTLTMIVIERGTRVGIRLWDRNAPARLHFVGLSWYPTDPAMRVEARFTPYDPPRRIPVANILGDVEPTPCPGYVEFTLGGHACRLDALEEGDELFFIFKDKTSGKQTYGPGRFLNSPRPKDGVVVLDFNKAYNPPCSYTPYATCPLPPRQNHLPVAIPAGEQTYRGHH